MYGEKVVVCIQYKKSATMRMQELGMTKTMMTNFQKSLLQRNGMILVSGSPGSGRRTTAYSCVLELLQETQLAMGWDPVIKYEVERMVQAKPEEKDEFSFADGIKAMMRQEPDIAYVGDIQCLDDVLACIQGTFAKRVVLCRMTSNNAISAMQNILDMGIQPFLLVASVKASLNQRLLRRLCPHCRVPYEPEKAIELELGFRLPPDSHFYRPKGCEKCGNSGFVGFAAIFELYLPSEEVNKMIVAKEPLQTIRQQAMQEKMASLKMDGIMKALRGWVTLEDVLLSL